VLVKFTRSRGLAKWYARGENYKLLSKLASIFRSIFFSKLLFKRVAWSYFIFVADAVFTVKHYDDHLFIVVVFVAVASAAFCQRKDSENYSTKNEARDQKSWAKTLSLLCQKSLCTFFSFSCKLQLYRKCFRQFLCLRLTARSLYMSCLPLPHFAHLFSLLIFDMTFFVGQHFVFIWLLVKKYFLRF